MFKRIGLFVLLNAIVMTTATSILYLLGIGRNGAYSNHLAEFMIFCFVWGMAGAFISLLLSRFMAKRMLGVKLVQAHATSENERKLLHSVEELLQKGNLSFRPEIGIFPSKSINAFATGPTKNKSLVAVSSKALETLDPNQLKAVLGHELAHIQNGDMVTMTLLQGVVNAFAIFLSRIIARLIASGGNNRNQGMSIAIYFVLTIALQTVFLALGGILIAWYSRVREYHADKGGAKLSSIESMKSALREIHSLNEVVKSKPAPEALRALMIDKRERTWLKLWATHPSLEQRLAALDKLAGA